ncbi:MAG: hypothetical protein AAGE84_31210 [Cyanobacteria bacterium P01_G01_bin.39]
MRSLQSLIKAHDLWQKALNLSLNNSLVEQLKFQKYRFLLGEFESSMVEMKKVIDEVKPPSALLESSIFKDLKLLIQAPQPPAEIDRLIAMLQQEIKTLAKNENFDDL